MDPIAEYPRYLYSPDGKMVLCATPAEAEERYAAGWADSPAAFGVETHPHIREEQFVLPQGHERQMLAHSAPAPASVDPGVMDALAQLTQQMRAMDERMHAMEQHHLVADDKPAGEDKPTSRASDKSAARDKRGGD